MGDMVTKIYLIRHGETEDPHPKRYKGHIDVPLSENGVKQIEAVARYLYETKEQSTKTGGRGIKNAGLHAVYCSDLERARKSAEIIAQPFGLEPVVMEELRERSFGEWEGMTFGEIQQKWPDAFRNWAADPLTHSPPGGESTLEVRDRVMKAIEEILGRAEKQTESDKDETGFVSDLTEIAVVAHGGVTRVLLCEYLGMPLENIFRIEQDFGCLNVIEVHDGFPIVKLLNFRARSPEP
jgi:broad specificity phosphatase PhoE